MASLTARLLLLAVLSTTGTAWAQDPETLIADGRQRYADLDYEGAAHALEEALTTPGLSPAAEAQALETLGFAYVVLDRTRDARRAFERLFSIDPYYDVREPTGSPRIEEFVEDVRHDAAPDAALDRGLDVRIELPRSAREGEPITIRVRTNGGAVRGVVLLVRAETATDWSRIDARRVEGGFEVETSAEAGTLDVYAEARDGRGRLLGRAASPLTPLHLEVRAAGARDTEAAPGGENLAEAWWLWTIVGVVVVGAAVGVGVGVASAPPGRAPDGTLPPFRVELP